MAVDFSNRESMLTLALQLSSASESYQDQAEILMDVSAALLEFVVYYRPYYVAANLLEQQLKFQRIKSADGVTFNDVMVTINSFYRLQSSIDLAKGWVFPGGMIAPVIPIEGTQLGLLYDLTTVSVTMQRV